MTATTALTTTTNVTTASAADTAGAHGHPSVVITEKTKQILFLRYGYKIGRTLAVINISNLTSEERKVDLPKELTALMKVKHRYVVRVYDIFRHHEHVFIFMELADGGDLAIYGWHHRPLREALVASWF
ncbi:protein serine threonine kinase [Tyrophagus putrescentiae]|nr:protein serine threonine kinase [Tyrophagus putrescentiae]